MALSLEENLKWREKGTRAERDVGRYWERLKSIEGVEKYIVSVELAKGNKNELKVLVDDDWHLAYYQARLQCA